MPADTLDTVKQRLTMKEMPTRLRAVLAEAAAARVFELLIAVEPPVRSLFSSVLRVGARAPVRSTARMARPRCR